jgi:large subunit ribosomal protein L1
MGKVRKITLGDPEMEAKQKEEAAKRREAKKALKEPKSTQDTSIEPVVETKEAPKGTKKPQQKSEPHRGKSYVEKLTARGDARVLSVMEGVSLLLSLPKARFDETVELHVNTTEKINGTVQLPHGSGKTVRVATLAPSSDPQGAEALLKEIESGKISFDVLIATPDAMPKLARVAKVLGPKGLMPNPKNGTVTPNVADAKAKFAGGQLSFKTESKSPIVHIALGKLSFGKEKLSENIQSVIAAMDATKVTSIYLKSTMSPSIKLR